MMITIYEYEKCASCRNAKKWLEKNKIAFKSIAIVEHPPSAKELKSFYKKSGLPIKKFFNISGMSYRNLNLSNKIDDLSVDECLDLLSKDGKLIKRPLLVSADAVLLGFKPDEYEKNTKD